MTEISSLFANPSTARASSAPVAASSSDADADQTVSSGRTVHDTVTLSEDGQKMINLSRGQELVGEIRSAPVDKDFAAKLTKMMEDIFRITRLFSETIKTAFMVQRR
jgi:hypothetical protein